MSISKTIIKPVSIIVIMCLLASLTATISSASYSPPFTTLRIGLSMGANVVPSANLRNADGMGRGFEFGYFDSNRNFVTLDAWTDVTGITMLMDRNMVWNQSLDEGRGQYREGTSGDVVVGCFHVQLNAGYGTFAEAKEEADKRQGAFVRYQSNQQQPFLVLIGQHTTRAGAESAISSMGLSGASVNAGTANTITITATGTNNIIFEFDRETTPLGIMPRPIGSEKTETWYKGYRYNGGFQYSRRGGADLTVIQMVNVEDYVKGILPYEMNNSWPIEALKAQALCARTYAMSHLNRHNSDGADMCVLEHCQVYRGRGAANARTDQAVDETAGLYVTYGDRLAQTFYASTNGGASENVENVWSESLPYLRGVVDPYEADIIPRVSNYYWRITYTPAQLTERLRNRITGFNLSTVASLRVSKYSPTGNAIEVTVTDVNGRSMTLSRRSQLLAGLGTPTMRFDIGNASWGPGSIFANEPSQPVSPGSEYFGIGGNGVTTAVPGNTMYAITGAGNTTTVDGETTTGGSTNGMVNGVFVINGAGNGHQIGMSQWGAFSMAHFHNKNFEDIIYFYFTGVQITNTR